MTTPDPPASPSSPRVALTDEMRAWHRAKGTSKRALVQRHTRLDSHDSDTSSAVGAEVDSGASRQSVTGLAGRVQMARQRPTSNSAKSLGE